MSLDMLCIDCNCILKDDLNDSIFYGIKKLISNKRKNFNFSRQNLPATQRYHTFLLATELSSPLKLNNDKNSRDPNE
jgi:hypothetical protein